MSQYETSEVKLGNQLWLILFTDFRCISSQAFSVPLTTVSPQVVVLCDIPLEKQLEINDWTHQNGVHFIAAETRGLFAYVHISILFSLLNRSQVLFLMILGHGSRV